MIAGGPVRAVLECAGSTRHSHEIAGIAQCTQYGMGNRRRTAPSVTPEMVARERRMDVSEIDYRPRQREKEAEDA